MLNPNRDIFFERLYTDLLIQLPRGLRSLKHVPKAGKNFSVFRFPEQSNTHYEIHFAPESKNHAAYFGEGYHEIIALYYGKADNRAKWLEIIQSFTPSISNMLGRKVVSGLWGKQWAWVAIDVSGDNIPKEPGCYAEVLSHFIQATYLPAVIALETVKQE